MRIINKKLILVLSVFVMASLMLVNLSFANKEIDIQTNKVDRDMFAMFLEQSDGTNKEYTDSNYFPNKGYKLNTEKSKCIDSKDNIVNNILYFDNKTRGVTVTSNKTVFCDLYYDKWDIYRACTGEENMSTCTENKIDEITLISNVSEEEAGGMYRYQGSAEEVNNNYVCFGTQDTEECTNNTDLYMYRIIGVTSDGYIKLIKSSALNGTYKWYEHPLTDIKWPDSNIYKGLNGIEGGTYTNIFVNSSSYTYMNTTNEWYQKIRTTNWKYGDETGDASYNGDLMYEIENGFSDSVDAKISLMYIHDYFYAYTNGNPQNSTNAKNSWIYSGLGEGTMTRYGFSSSSNGDGWCIRAIYKEGVLSHYSSALNFQVSLRPVFYLENTIKVIDGNGTIERPYIIA